MLDQFRDLLLGDLGEEQYHNEILNFLNIDEEQERRTLSIDYNDITEHIPELAVPLAQNPSVIIPQLNDVFQEVIRTTLPEGNQYVDNIGAHRFRVRIYNTRAHPMGIRELRSDTIKRLIETSGVVTKTTEVKPMVVEAVFQCLSCSTAAVPTLIRVPQEDVGTYRPPAACSNASCRGKKFRFRSEYSTFVDYQEIRIQENPENVKGGDMPRSVPVIVTDELAGLLVPGDRCTITGILLMTPDFQIFKYLDDVPSFSTYVDCVHIQVESGEVGITITEEDVERIQGFVRAEVTNGTIYQTLIASIAPSLYGLDNVKEGCLLALFGGVTSTFGNDRERGDSHILLMGDPATAKGALLNFLKYIIPRGMYTSGEGTSSAGLLAAVTQKKTGAWVLEAGVLVLCDQGVALIDELDKIHDNDRKKLHTAMEQQVFPVAKAGIVTSLNSRTTIISAANPKWGRYDSDRTWIENINLPPTIVSRFDLIFLLRDKPNWERDGHIARHILKRGKEETITNTPIDIDFFKKYIYHARKHCHPQLTDEADARATEWYQNTRKTFKEYGKPQVVTPRQLQAIKRLATARAKIRLSQYADVEDVNRIIEMYAEFLKQVAIDPETGETAIDFIMTGASKSHRDQTERVFLMISHLASSMNLKLVSFDLICENFQNQNPDGDPEVIKKFVSRHIAILQGERGQAPARIIEPHKDKRYQIVE